jgi:signal transduction histidine kinase
MINWRGTTFQNLKELLEETSPPPAEMSQRLQAVERDIILPVKVVFIGILFYYLYLSHWFEDLVLPRSLAQLMIERFFLFYLVFNIGIAFILMNARLFSALFVQRTIFTSNFVDDLFIAALALVTGGFDSLVYWLFIALIVRNAVSSPLAFPQLILNFSAILCYVLAGVMDVAIAKDMLEFEDIPRGGSGNLAEPAILRVMVLALTSLCCYGVQVLLEKKHLADEEAQEFSTRQQQLNAAGRLAAQIAHQIKNPLSIINNAAYCLQRSASYGRNAEGATEQTDIIREEIDKVDRIITKLMGYAQLAEGKLERLDVEQELEQAITSVFPSAAWPEMRIGRDFDEHLPPLLMQRNHFSEILMNLMTNAREATCGRGRVQISARKDEEGSVVIKIQDDGPGIPPEYRDKIFQPYFTTKEKGTGLGLPIVRNNAEMYGGSIQLHSELGKGTTFTVTLPTRTLVKPKP